MVIVCLGEALIDLVPPDRISLESTSSLAVQPGGAPLNVSIGLARLGRESHFLGSLSCDGFGERLSGILEREGVRRSPEVCVSAPTRLAVVDHSNSEAPFRFYGDAPADSKLSNGDVDVALEILGVTGLYVSSLMMKNEPGSHVQRYAIEQAIKRNITIYSDPNPRPPAWASRQAMIETTSYLLERSTLSKLSLDDARALGWPDEPEALLTFTKERFPCELFLTDGAAGCWMDIDGHAVHVRTPTVEPVDPTGAGDASFAALIANLHGTADRSESHLRFAAAAGALATLKQGAVAALPTRVEVESFLDESMG